MLAVYIYKTFAIYVVCKDESSKERDGVCLQFPVSISLALTPTIHRRIGNCAASLPNYSLCPSSYGLQ